MPGRRNGEFYSGGGTDPRNDRDGAYVRLVQSMVSRDDVRTVVEMGCGDWEVSGRIDWSGVSYTGYDVVPGLVEYNTRHFGREGISFVCGDLVALPDVRADLLIVKDVFQHLPPSYCAEFVRSIPGRFRWNLVTNDFGPGNAHIAPGGYTTNDFGAPPFGMGYDLLISWSQVFAEAGDKRTVMLR